MTFQPIMNEMLDIVVKWVGESKNPFVLYKELFDLNEKHGYGHEEYDQSARSVANAMLKLGNE